MCFLNEAIPGMCIFHVFVKPYLKYFWFINRCKFIKHVKTEVRVVAKDKKKKLEL